MAVRWETGCGLTVLPSVLKDVGVILNLRRNRSLGHE
jgi:hypothetical protein